MSRHVPAAWSTATPEAVLAARLRAVDAFYRNLPGDVTDSPGLAEAAVLERAAAETAQCAGRPLAAANAALPWPDEPHLVLWQAATVLREHRGDGHLAALVAAGLDGVQANELTELWVGWDPLSYTGSRAWAPERMEAGTSDLEARGWVEIGRLTDEGLRVRRELEEATDRAAAGAVGAIADDLDRVLPLLEQWSARVVEHGWFPPDPYKRASG